MARWTIYGKDGNPKAITTGVTVGSRTLPELEYSGTWMGECFVTVTAKSEQPINWQLGDYMLYRGEKFVLNYDPSVIKQARANTYGEAFVYDNVKFNSLAVELTDVQFLDVVLSDNKIHYTSLPAFSFFANDIEDLADRLQANCNRYCRQNGFAISDWWIILTPSLTRTVARGKASGETADEKTAFEDLFRNAWNANYSSQDNNETGKLNQNVSVSNQSISQALALIKSTFDLNFVNKGRQVIIGAPARIVGHEFAYGRGNGLHQIERVVDSEQQVITKLIAYGGNTNLPIRYYADINKVCFADVLSIEQGVAKLDVLFSRDRFNGYQDLVVPYPLYKVLFHVDGGQKEGYVSDHINQDTAGDGSCYLFSSNLEVGDRIYFDSGVVVDKWPSGHFSYINEGKILPDNLAVNNLMLPGFPTQSLYDWVIANNGIAVQDGRNNSKYGRATWTYNNVTYDAFFSKDKLNPYILSLNYDSVGIREYTKFFDGSDESDDIYPTIENTGADHLVSADVIEDNGVFEEGATVPDFHITIPSLGQNVEFNSLIKEDTTISMKDGYCGGREFKVVSASKNNNGSWDVTLQREPDDALQLYFPYSDKASRGETAIAYEAYQLRGSDIEDYDGDKFVIIGIDMPETYVEESAKKLLSLALEYLFANQYVRYTYVPKVDEIFMAREHDAATAGTSLHDTLKEGDLMQFEDDDLSIEGNIFIDTLHIKEYGNNGIPTYDVTLKETKTVGTIERIKQQIDNLKVGVGVTYGSATGGLSTSQVKTLISSEGDKRYIRRDVNDETDTNLTANNFIAKRGIKTDEITPKTPNKPISMNGDVDISGDSNVEGTLHVEKVAVYGENANGGDIVAQSSIYQAQVSGWAIDKNGNMEVSSLKVRNYLETEELRINRLQAQEGDTIFTDNDQIEEVEQVIDETDGSVSYILTFKDKWEGYFTAQRYGNILRGVINTLAEAYFAKQQGRQPIVDKDSPDYDDLPSDSGGNKFFTSWMKIIADRNTAQGRLGLNQVQVVLYADDQTLIPQDKNFPPCVGMVVAHWGCFDYSVPVLPDDTPEEKAQKEELIADIKKRQVFFYLSASEGRIMKLSQVDKPLLEEHNFGMTFGKTPDFIKQWPNYQSLIADHPSLADKDYLFAQGILCHDFIPVTPRTDKPLSTVVFCGDWEDGTNMSGKYFEPAYDQLVDLPCPMHGIYYHGAYNEYTGRYETHTVRHNSGTWMCLENQPVVSGGVSTYYPPKFGSPYWKLIDGNENYSIEFVSSNGQAFYRGNVDTMVTPNLFIGNVDITADISVSNWWWERSLEHPTAESEQRDETWNANHKRMRILHLTNEDMPMEWGLDNKVSFTCKVTINDGKTTRTVNNQVIV